MEIRFRKNVFDLVSFLSRKTHKLEINEETQKLATIYVLFQRARFFSLLGSVIYIGAALKYDKKYFPIMGVFFAGCFIYSHCVLVQLRYKLEKDFKFKDHHFEYMSDLRIVKKVEFL